MYNLKIKKTNDLVDTENRLVIAKGGETKRWVEVVKGTNFQL